MEIKNKHFLVTGGARRVGLKIALHLLSLGARVTVHRHESPLGEELRAFGDRVGEVVGDLTRDWEGVAARVTGPLDGLIHSASQYAPTPMGKVSLEDWDRYHRLHGQCAFFLTQALLPILAPSASVVLIGDVNGERPLVGYSAYAASKSEVLFLTRQLAKELAPQVRVNSVSPGAVLLPPSYTEAQKQRSIDRSLLKRVGSAEDVAHAVEFLMRNDYMTGTNLRVDGGRSLADY